MVGAADAGGIVTASVLLFPRLRGEPVTG
jgi:hypothetical protein